MPADKNMHILIVDDFSTMRRIIRNILKQIGFSNISEAEDGQQALELLKKEQIDFLISDWNMPVMDGLTLLKKVRAEETLKRIPYEKKCQLDSLISKSYRF